MVLAPREGAVEEGLGDDHRPPRMPAARRGERVEHGLLRRIVDARYGDDQVRLCFAPAYVLGRVVPALAEATSVEEAQDGRFRRKVVGLRRPGAGRDTAADLGSVRADQRRDDRSLARAGLAEQPHHRRHGSSTLTCPLESLVV